MNTLHQLILHFIFALVATTFIHAQQRAGIPFTASYDVTIQGSHIIEKDKSGGVLQAISYVPGKGEHSILGDVTTISIVRLDVSSGENTIEFVETDKEGNSLFVTTKAINLDATTWECHGAIMGGTGKYKMATGYYKAVGSSIDTSSSWKAEGILYYNSEAEEVAAIKQVIIDETIAYLNSDNEKGKSLRSYPYTNVINMPQDQAVITSIESDQEDVYGAEPFDLQNIKRTDWDIQIRDHLAWATFKQTMNALGSHMPTLETRILEKVGGSWKIAHIQTLLDYAHAHPPLEGPFTSRPEIYSIHEVELQPGVDPAEFETFFNSTIAPIYNRMEGQRVILAKADRGLRTAQYSAILAFDSVTTRDRIYAQGDVEINEEHDIWGPKEIWDKLARMTKTNLGERYSDYVMIPK